MAGNDPRMHLSWPRKLRLTRRNLEHWMRNFLLRFFRTLWCRTQPGDIRSPLNPAEVLSGVRRILLLRTGRSIGDAVMALVLIPECRRLFPTGSVDLLLRDNVAPLFNRGSGADCVLELHPRFLLWPAATWRLLRHLRCNRYDFVVACDSPYKSSLTTIGLGLFTGARWRLGFENEESRSFFNITVSPVRGDRMIGNLLRLLSILGPMPTAAMPHLQVSAELPGEIVRTLGAGARPVLVFVPQHWRKSWPLDAFLRVAGGLLELKHPVILAFGPGDTRTEDTRVRAWLERSGGRARLLPSLPLDVFASTVAKTRLFISNDCGPYHLAVAVGVPSVAAFLSADALNDFAYRREGQHVAIHHPDPAEAERLTIQAALHLLR